MSDMTSFLPIEGAAFSQRLKRSLPESVVRWLAPPRMFSAMLLDGPSWMFGLLVTLVFFTVLNTWLLRQLERDYASRIVPELDVEQSLEKQAVNRLLRRLDFNVSSPSLRKNLDDVMSLGLRRPASAQFIALVEQVVGQPGEGSQQQLLRKLVHDQFTGNVGGFRPFVLTLHPTTGEQLIAELEKVDRPAANALQDLSNGDARKMLVRFADVATQELNPSLRALARYNGFVQWLTVFLGFTIVGMAGRRAVACYQRIHAPVDPGMDPDWQKLREELRLESTSSGQDRERERGLVAHAQSQLDEGPFATLGFLLGLLPSLGFLGTVWGMGGALLEAEGLFSSVNKQEVIHRITNQLGFAFDTTLVALAASMIAGLVVVAVRAWEFKELRQMESGFSPPLLATCEETIPA